MNDNLYLYPRQKIFGAFLVAIAFTMYLTIIFPYKGTPNGALFGLCYVISIFGIMLNPIVRKKFSAGKGSNKQKMISNLSLLILVIGAFIIFKVFKTNDYRTIWILLFALVGVHFIMFIPVHGKLIGILGLILIVNAVIAIIYTSTPLNLVFIIDGTIKLIFGIIYLKISPINW